MTTVTAVGRFSETRIVHWGDCAPSGAVFYPTYFRWFDEATWNLFALLGLPIDSLGARYGVVGLPLRENDCKYRKPCRLGDTLTVTSRIFELSASEVVVQHQITNAGHLAVISRERRFWGLRDPRDPARMQKGTIPADVSEVLKTALDATADHIHPTLEP